MSPDRESPTSLSEGKLLSKSRLIGAALLVLIGGAAFKDRIQSCLGLEEPTSPAASETYIPQKDELPPSPEKPNPLANPIFSPDQSELPFVECGVNLDKYAPPAAEGVIIDSHFAPGNKKTILYIADQHVDPNLGPHQEESVLAQKQQFAILQHLVGFGKKFPIVFENWLKGLDLRVGLQLNRTPELTQILDEQDPKKKMELIQKSIGSPLTPSTILTLLAYPQFIPVGSVNAKEFARMNSIYQEYMNVLDATTYPDQLLCGENSPLTLQASRVKFEKGQKSGPEVDCYCGYRRQMEEVVDGFEANRFEEAPKQEVSSALEYPSDFIIIVAGVNHVQKSLELMKGAPVNYVVVSPRATEKTTRQVISTRPVRPKTLPDNKAGTCGRWEREQAAAEAKEKEAARKSFQKWLDEE